MAKSRPLADSGRKHHQAEEPARAPYGLAETGRIVSGPRKQLEHSYITAMRDHIATTVNGKKVADYTDDSGWYGSGAISLVVMADAVVQFEEIMIEELPD